MHTFLRVLALVIVILVACIPTGKASDTPVRTIGGEGALLFLWDASDDVASYQLLITDEAFHVVSESSLPGDETEFLLAPYDSFSAYNVLLLAFDSDGSILFSHDVFVPYMQSVRITEVMPNPVGSDDFEWIEIGNLGPHMIDVTGWKLAIGSRSHIISSGGVLIPGAHLLLPKSRSGLSLRNTGDTIVLHSDTTLIDTFPYPETPEGISFGIIETTAKPICLPSPGHSNASSDIDPQITIQSGETIGEGSISINLQATVLTGALTGSTCIFRYPNGKIVQSCNPPITAIDILGTHSIEMEVTSYCGNTMIRKLDVEVLPKPVGVSPKVSVDACILTDFGGVVISEFLPDPISDEIQGEWIELYNPNPYDIELCGWLIDDEDKGSKAFRLDGYIIRGRSYLVLPRFVTGIALNNDGDTVRLYAPTGFDDIQKIDEYTYEKVKSGYSVAQHTDGRWFSALRPTPGSANRVPDGIRRSEPGIELVRALPNPSGKDEKNEWIELRNSSSSYRMLTGWTLRDQDGDVVKKLDDMNMESMSITKIILSLRNSNGGIYLADPDGIVISGVDWANAEESKEYRTETSMQSLGTGLIHTLYDDGSFSITFDGETASEIHQMLGISIIDDNGKKIARALLENQNVELFFDANTSALSKKSSVYIRLMNKNFIQEELLRRGAAILNYTHHHSLEKLFSFSQAYAQEYQLDLWASAEQKSAIVAAQEQQKSMRDIQVLGLQLGLSTDPGLVDANQIIQIIPSFSASIRALDHQTGQSIFGTSLMIDADKTYTITAVATACEGLSSDLPDYCKATIDVRYIPRKTDYGTPIRLSELAAAAVSGSSLLAEEWVELKNMTDRSIPLIGWSLDDEQGAGSKPYYFRIEQEIEPHGYLVIPESTTNIAFNDGGDDVHLRDPNGKIVSSFRFEKAKKGESLALFGHRLCATTTPTPGAENICTIAPPKKAKKTVSSSKEKSPVVSDPFSFLTTKYRALLDAIGASHTQESAELSAIRKKAWSPSGREIMTHFTLIEGMIVIILIIAGLIAFLRLRRGQ